MRILISVAVVIVGIGLPTMLGLAWSDYSAASNYLSELGAISAPHANIMNYAGFLLIGVLWAVGVLTLLSGDQSKRPWIGVLLLLGTSVSYVGAAFFPCDAGCPLEGSTSQMMHNALGIVGYLASPIGLALLAAHFFRANQIVAGRVSIMAIGATIIGFLMMANPDFDSTKGAWQRLADFSLFIWLFAISICLRRGERRDV